MYGRKKKIFLYGVSALVSLLVINNFSDKEELPDISQTSLLNIAERSIQEKQAEPPDLSIESVSLKKLNDPSKDFNYYKYRANILLKNQGGGFENAKVVLSGDHDQKSIFLKNSDAGFSLNEGQNFIIDEYEVLFDGNYNGGTITLNVDFKDREDYYATNNSYPVGVFELPPKIEAIGVKNVTEDNEFKLEYEFSNFFLNTDKLAIYTSDSLQIDEAGARYDEISVNGKPYGYHRAKISNDLAEQDSWKKIDEVKFIQPPFEDETVHYVYLRVSNEENDYYAVSNILRFSPQQTMSRAEFAKLFIDYADVELYREGEINYRDVQNDAWYADYVQTLYNLGLIGNDSLTFAPDEKITRAAVLRVVMDYFDIDLSTARSKAYFADVSRDDFIFTYIQALFEIGKAGIFGENFHPSLPATRNFMKYLINEFK